MYNIWLPLDDVVSADPLVLIDAKVSKDKSIKPYSAVRRGLTTFGAQVLEKREQKMQALYMSKFGRGDCVIFNSTQTLHSAVKINGQSGSRKSVEVRILLIET